jgi:hypothetical protein
VNSRFVPDATSVPAPEPRRGQATAAIVTASYAPDFERCRLLCETIDRFVTGASCHYILVEDRDVALFRQLETRTRTVISERDLLPQWLRPYDDPFSLFRRRIWLSHKTQPLRGWHVQQLRRIAIAAHAREAVLVYCDSDVAFLKPFDCGAFWRDGRVRLFRRDDGVADALSNHEAWSRNAGRALGIGEPAISPHDYIATLISWRRDAVQAMCSHIEKVHSRHWVEVIASARQFSECMIYGRYVDEVIGGAAHFHGAEEFCRVQWFPTEHSNSDAEVEALIAEVTLEQVAIGMQSFIGTDIARIRRLLGARW